MDLELLRRQQLERFDSGKPTAIFHERFDGVTISEGYEILEFLEAFKDELKDFQTSKGTIRFAVDKPLPAALVKKLVKARIAENERKKQR